MKTFALLLLGVGPQASPDLVEPIDFAKISRTMEREPTYVGEPRYGMFLFSPRPGESEFQRVWAVLDRSASDVEGYDVLFLDRNANGVLGEEGERIVGSETGDGWQFEIGDLTQPGTEIVHTRFELTWTPESVRYRMMWRDKTITMGGFGPSRATYASFGASREDVTIYVPGYDRPLEFEHWISDKLRAGASNDFKVFLGARGSSRGAFSSGDQKLLPDEEYVIATLIYRDGNGKEQRVRAELRERC